MTSSEKAHKKRTEPFSPRLMISLLYQVWINLIPSDPANLGAGIAKKSKLIQILTELPGIRRVGRKRKRCLPPFRPDEYRPQVKNFFEFFLKVVRHVI